MRLYLDTCCLNRPFDDRSATRVQQEAVAVEWLLDKVRAGQYALVGSDALDAEVDAISDAVRRVAVREALSLATIHHAVTSQDFERATVLVQLGFKPIDALHIACAEASGAAAFLSPDDRLLRCALRNLQSVTVTVANPSDWC